MPLNMTANTTRTAVMIARVLSLLDVVISYLLFRLQCSLNAVLLG